MSYLGDIRLGSTIDVKFTTRRLGVPFTLAGSPAVSAYVNNSTTEITAGVTLTVDFDSIAGLNNVRVVASAGNGFAAGTNVALVITSGTVDSVSVVGEVVGSFSLENRSALMPTAAGRTLDVSAGGEAGLDWANIGTPGSTVSLSATTVSATTNVTTVNGLAAGVVTAASIADGAIAAAKIATDAITAAQLAASAVSEIQSGLSTLTGANVRTECEGALQTYHLDHLIAAADPGSIVANSSLWAALTSKSATPAYSSYVNTTDSLEAQRDNIGAAGAALSLAKTTNITGFNDLSAAQVNAEADAALSDVGLTTTVTGRVDRAISAIFTTAMTESYNVDGAAPTPAQALFVMMQGITEFGISGVTKTVKKLDGSTTAYTETLDISTTPTSITRTT